MTTISGELYADILRLYADYAHGIDFGDIDAWVDCFTDDPTFTSLTGKRFEGRDGVRGFGEALWEHQNTHRHWNNQVTVLRVEGDSVWTRCFCLLVDVGRMPPVLQRSVTYSDELLRTPEGFRFVSRSITADEAS